MPRLLTLAPAFALLLSLALLAQQASAYNNGVGRTPALGWNTWCTGGFCGTDVCNEVEVRSVADAMVANGMQSLGYTYINLDDCWGGPRATNGSYQPGPGRFPSGMAALADYLHARGFKLGVYTDAGTYTCNTGLRPEKIPGSYGHYAQDAATFAAWGVDYVKMDWCNHDINGTALDPRVVYKEMSEGLNATGRPIWFNMCEWGEDQPWTWGPAVAQAWRAGPDHKDEWSNTANVIENMVGKGKYAAPYGWNDFDFVMTGGQECLLPLPNHVKCPGQTDTEYQTEYTMWVIAASPVIVATDVRRLSPIMQFLLFNPEVIAVHQDELGSAGDRLGFVVENCTETASCQVWARELADGTKAVALYNNGTKEQQFSVDFDTFFPSFTTTGNIQIRDLWERLDIGKFDGSFSTPVIPSHGVRLYKFTAV